MSYKKVLVCDNCGRQIYDDEVAAQTIIYGSLQFDVCNECDKIAHKLVKGTAGEVIHTYYKNNAKKKAAEKASKAKANGRKGKSRRGRKKKVEAVTEA